MASYTDEYEKISYRQAGRLPNGKIAKGVIDRSKGPGGQKLIKKANRLYHQNLKLSCIKVQEKPTDLVPWILGLKHMETKILV